MNRSRKTGLARATGLVLLFCLAACGQTQKTPSPSLQADKTRYATDLAFIARAPRTTVEAQHEAVQDLCARRFSALGLMENDMPMEAVWM
jgi:hypothetical protein